MRLLPPRIILASYGQENPMSCRRVLSTTSGIIFACFSIVYLLALRFCYNTNFRDPTSYFFDPTRAYQRIYSAERIQQAESFLQEAEHTTGASGSHPMNQVPLMCIGIVTVTRRTEQYVGKTVGSLLEGLDESERNNIYLNLLIGHTDPAKHPLHHEKWIETFPNNLLIYEEKDISLIKSWEDGEWYRNKTIFDYTYLMRNCYSTGAQYIVMVEDDTLAMRGWYARTLQALQKIEATMATRQEGSKWLYLRLFYTEDLFGWNSEYWAQYLSWSYALWILLNVALLGARRRSKSLQSHLSNTAILLLSCVYLPAFIVLYFMAGRNSMLPLTPGIHEMNKYGCCSQAYVFPREIVPTFLSHTDLETDCLVDMMVEKISDEQDYVRWATAPALIQHIGTTSSKGHGFDNTAKSLWNFGFELHQDTSSSFIRSVG